MADHIVYHEEKVTEKTMVKRIQTQIKKAPKSTELVHKLRGLRR